MSEDPIRDLQEHIDSQGDVPSYEESEHGYLMGLKDALRIIQGQEPEWETWE